MQVLIFDDKAAVANNGAELIKKLINTKPNANLGLATGSTPVDLYKQLIVKHKNKEVYFSQVSTFN
jgi:glucosamine-6-phosphate deaminase